MSNLRWIVRDGKQILQEANLIGDFVDVPTIMPEPPKKSLAQVLFEKQPCDYPWDKLTPEIRGHWIRMANNSMDYLEKEGWRRPNE